MGSKLRPPKQSNGVVKPTHRRDAVTIYGDLRPADLKEIEAHGACPMAALLQSVEVSGKCYTIWIEDEPVGIFGIASGVYSPSTGYPWLMGTPGIERISWQFLRESRKWLDELAEGYHLLTNVVHEENELHVKWLRFLGMKFLERKPPFLEFAKICVSQPQQRPQ